MRVIAGQVRGRNLAAPRGNTTRPATARVRASIFSRLASRGAIAEARVLDVFAGSGALGIEALSREAREAIFVDSSPRATRAIAANLQELQLTSRARIITAGFRQALNQLAQKPDPFDLIFIDPPFRSDSIAEVLALIARLGLLAPDGIVVTRQFHRMAAPMVTDFECINVTRLGDHRIALYRRL